MMQRIWSSLTIVGVVFGLVIIVGHAARFPTNAPDVAETAPASGTTTIAASVSNVDAYLNDVAHRRLLPRIAEEQETTAITTPLERADDLTILRRLSLALHGTIPSLEEIRRFEADREPDRLDRWTVQMLRDSRFDDYFSERLTRVFAGVQFEPFILYRRDQFRLWLARQLRENRPYDQIVQEMLTAKGIWTENPAVNYLTSTIVDEKFDENKLAGKTVRAFLGQRIDCAQCHDHFFADWTQDDFQGIAAYFSKLELSPVGVHDLRTTFEVTDGASGEEIVVDPHVPFKQDILPREGTSREDFAHWVTHENNFRFERATVNRVWGLLFGTPYSESQAYAQHFSDDFWRENHRKPVDDLHDPPEEDDLLAILGRDFREHGYDLKRLIRVIAGSSAFRASSSIPETLHTYEAQLSEFWVSYPLVRLRPEQVIGSALQATSLSTIDQNSHLLVRTIRFFRQQDFVDEYGDFGADELDKRAGTIPQALIRMNGRLFRETIEPNLFNASGRVARLSPGIEETIDAAYLTCLTRHPTDEEREYFVEQFQSESDERRAELCQDLFWALFNSPEFSWNH